ncbi:MAG: S41 family peptidase [Saprospiraceae bacterium]
MKSSLYIPLLFLLFTTCKSQPANTTYAPIITKAQKVSLYSDAIDWEAVNTKYVELTEGKTSTEDLKPGLQYLINALEDKHATIRSAFDQSIIVSYSGELSGEDNRKANFINNVMNDVSAKFSYQLLGDSVGYLNIVGIGPGDVKAQADFIRHGLVELKAKGVDRWIVDLRFNGGGNIEPMLSGLAPLVGEGFIGGAINRTGDIREYTIENDQFTNWGRLTCEMEEMPSVSADEKVVVLLSRYTISSGELVAVAFKSRDNTLFIGEETAGYTTGNGYEPVGEELVLVISQDVFIDRNKNRYDGKVGVDEKSEFRHGVKMMDDNQVARAVEWLGQ